MNYLYNRAVSLLRYLINRGLDPYEAVDIVFDKYKNSRINRNKLKAILENEVKSYLKYEKGIYD